MLEGSSICMLETIRKRLSSLPSASNSGKYFWLARIVRIRHSCGTARNSASNSPTYTVGCSTSAVTSSRQVGVFAQGGALAAGLGDELLLDVGAALGEIGDHLALGQQRGLVGVGAGDVDVAAAHEAVAAGGTAGLDVEQLPGTDAGAVEHRELVGRAHEGGVAVTPAHHLGDGQRLESVLHDAGEHLGELGAGHRAGVEQGLGLAVEAALEAGNGRQGDALGFGAFLVRAAVGWPLASRATETGMILLGDFAGGGLGQHAGQGHGQAARGGEPAEGAVGRGQTARTQAGGDAVGKGLAELRQGLGREFFGEQFYEQGRRRSSRGLLLEHREAEGFAEL